MNQLQEELNELWKGWVIGQLIGEGSFGKVYEIKRKDFGHVYKAALKVITIPQNSSEIRSVMNEGMDEKSVTEYFQGIVEEIVKEFVLMSKLKGNSTIVSYEDHAVVPHKDKIGWNIYIRMELLTPLFDYIKENELSVRDIIRLGMDMCRALEICQRYNIIHRDIKPENIFVSELGKFKLGDFGIARQMEKTSSGLSKKGTYSYMAPEVYKGEKYNSTVDIYSLGIVLYRFLNNSRIPFLAPFPEKISYSDKERANIMRMSGVCMPAPCNAKGRLAEIVLKACAYDPKDRYESAIEMRRALEGVLYKDEEIELAYPDGDYLPEDTPVYINSSDKTVNIFGTAKGEFGEKAKENMEYISSESIKEKGYISKSKNKNDFKGHFVDKSISGNKINRNKKKFTMMFCAILLTCVVLIGYQKFTKVMVPDFSSHSFKEAMEIAKSNSVKIEKKKESYSDKVKLGDVISQDLKMGTKVNRGSVIRVVVSKGKLITVPKIVNVEQKKAHKMLEKLGLKMKVEKTVYSDKVKKGCIISKDPDDKKLGEGTEILVKVSKGIEQVTVPKVSGLKKSTAMKKLKKAKLNYTEKYKYSSSVRAGYIISQGVDAGKKVDKNKKIVIVISRGKQPQTNSASRSTPSTSSRSTSSSSVSKPVSSSKPRPSTESSDDSDSWDVVN